MAYAHEPLDEQALGPGVWRVVGPNAPAPMRGMVARGLAPLPPRDLVVALYHLWCTNDPEHGTVAGKTVEGLPAAVLEGALADPGLPAGVLDFLGRKLLRNAELLDKVVRHPAADDETLAGLARVCPETVCDTLAENQQRWLAYPKIVESLYQNPNCRMSVVHRMLELAVREGVDVRLPNMEEIRQALAEEGGAPDPDRDALFQAASGSVAGAHAREVSSLQEAAPEEEVDLDAARLAAQEDGEEEGALDLDALLAGGALDLPLEAAEPAEDEGGADPANAGEGEEPEAALGKRVDAAVYAKLRPMERIRLALMGDAFERALAIRDSNRAVAMSAIKSPRVKENEVVAYAANRTLPHEVIRYIATRRDWTKLYAVKLNLVMNPKTPMALSMGFIGHLHGKDVRKVAQSKNIPSALAAAAKRRLSKRR